MKIDLNAVRDGNSVATVVGLRGPQLVPSVDDLVAAIDEDGTIYDARVEAVFPDSRVYLRVAWATAREQISVFSAPTVFSSDSSWLPMDRNETHAV